MRNTLLIIFTGLATGLHAQGTQVLTLRQAVQMALTRNIVLQQEINNLASTHVSQTERMLQATPQVSLSGRAGRYDGNSFNQQEGIVVNGVQDFIGASLNATMPLFTGLSTIHQYRQSTASHDAQENRVHRVRQDVIRNVAAQYLRCLLSQQLQLIQQKNLEVQQQQYIQISEQVKAGARAEVDLYNQDFQVKSAEVQLLRASINLRNDKMALAQLLMMDPSADFDLAEPSWKIEEVLVQTSPEELREQAEASRSDLKQRTLQQKALLMGYYASRGSYFPQVNLFAQYGSQYNYIHPNVSFTPDNRTFRQQFFRDNTQLTYGLQFSIPIYTGFRNRANVVRSRVEYRNAELETENARLMIRAEVQQAWQNYQDARSVYEANSAQLRAATLAYTLEQERFQLGITDVVTWMQAVQGFIRAQAEMANATYTLLFQKIMLDYAIGTLRPEDIPE
jgi:outer membrane protein